MIVGLFAFGVLISFVIAAYAGLSEEDKPKDDEREDDYWRAIK